jgi:hypothetical protein
VPTKPKNARSWNGTSESGQKRRIHWQEITASDARKFIVIGAEMIVKNAARSTENVASKRGSRCAVASAYTDSNCGRVRPGLDYSWNTTEAPSARRRKSTENFAYQLIEFKRSF